MFFQFRGRKEIKTNIYIYSSFLIKTIYNKLCSFKYLPTILIIILVKYALKLLI